MKRINKKTIIMVIAAILIIAVVMYEDYSSVPLLDVLVIELQNWLTGQGH